ncbi:molybdopterin-dependent oxidoreductase [Epidermidibacterium keratini]|uniref:Molybdopterin-dependent oxidoreductase n=1 Tax=Epidermidibacterium keratini TaxID=1891644 RepID=A0A7L4YN67_9ACTN|nr:xanthine dehydrogenase family protein molybdopterin-binding subunit [Epidermidibacterium keratini]QHC00259.1 molybdopterin-dependent oxidoreductase [Epidermidibacterium keratini]
MSILGTRVLRTEDPRFLTGTSTYTADLEDDRLTGALHAHFVRSSVPHGRIVGIDAKEARDMPGVVAVYTADDIPMLPIPPAMRPLERNFNRQPLATDTVRFVGEPVAIVLAETPAQAADAAELVEVDIDWLDPVIDPQEALSGTTLLFPDAGTNVTVSHGSADDFDDAVFDQCEVVVSREIRNPRLAVASMEGRAGACFWGEDGRLTMWLSNQGAQSAKAELALHLGLRPEMVRVITPDVGGAFGAKFRADPEHSIVAAASRRAGYPVRWVEDRTENMLGMTHGRGQIQQVTIGGSRDGKITAYRLQVLQDAGAYPRMGAMLPSGTRLMAPGVYDIAELQTRSESVVTNTTPVGAYRGAGRPEAAAAIERAVDLFASEIGMDPAEVRRRNFIPADAFPFTTKGGATYDSGNYAGALGKVLEVAGYDKLRAEQQARRAAGDRVQLGLGLSTYVEVTFGGDKENATVELHPDGSVTVLTGTSPHGQGHATAWAMIVSDQLGVPVERITVIHGDTDLIPHGGGTGGSRSLQLGGVAVQAATRDLVEEALKRAASRLEADVSDLQVDARRQAVVVRGAEHASVALADLTSDDDPLSAYHVWNGEGQTYPFGAHLAVVEVDTETGDSRLRALYACDDAGRVLNPMLFDGQRHGGIAQGASQALYEEFVYDEDGNPLTASFLDYPFPSAADLPSFELIEQRTETPLNPLGAKGIGEAGTIGATPAVQNAVIDAIAHLGVRHIDMPLTPERVWRAISSASSASARAHRPASAITDQYDMD